MRLICSAAWARICIASTSNQALKPSLDTRRLELLNLWRNVLLEQSPSAFLSQETSPGSSSISLSARKDLEVGIYKCRVR